MDGRSRAPLTDPELVRRAVAQSIGSEDEPAGHPIETLLAAPADCPYRCEHFRDASARQRPLMATRSLAGFPRKNVGALTGGMLHAGNAWGTPRVPLDSDLPAVSALPITSKWAELTSCRPDRYRPIGLIYADVTFAKRPDLRIVSSSALVDPAVLGQLVGSPANEARCMPEPYPRITSCHGFVKIDVKSCVIHTR
jgi:hypothetical protein